MEIVGDICPMLVEDVAHHEEDIRTAASESLAHALQLNNEYVSVVIKQLLQLYREKYYVRIPNFLLIELLIMFK